MKKANSQGLRSRIAKLVALTLALVLIVGALPVSAASKEVVVKTKKQLLQAMEKKSSATIIFKTNRKTRFIIPALENSANKKLVMEAPNARAFNKATFKTITLNNSEYFNERGKDNSLYIKGDGIKLTISKGIEAKKVSISATDVLVKVAKNADVANIICNKKAATITVNVAKNADANITIKKKTDLTVTGDKTADIKIVAQAKNSKITASAPVEIVAEKNVDVVLEKGSEGSKVESAKGVDVDLSGAAKKNATVVEDGKTVQEAEKVEEKKEEKKEDKKDTTSGSVTTPSTDSTSGSGSGSSSGNPDPTPATVTKYTLGVRLDTEAYGTYTITVDGTAVASGSAIEAGKSVVVRFTPDTGYMGLVHIVGGGTTNTSNTDAEMYTVTGFSADFTIVISFIVRPDGSGEGGEGGSTGTVTPAAITLVARNVVPAVSGTAICSLTDAASGAGISMAAATGSALVWNAKFDLTKDGAAVAAVSVASNGAFTVTVDPLINSADVTEIDLTTLYDENFYPQKLLTAENLQVLKKTFTKLEKITFNSRVRLDSSAMPNGVVSSSSIRG